MSDTRKVYLAGPGVFRPDAVAIGHTLKEMCSAAKLTGLWPGDNDPPELAGTPAASKDYARELFRANCNMIRQCDALVADITPFRGVHCDVGTAWEIGMAFTLGKPVFAYSDRQRAYPMLILGNNGSTHLIERIWCEESPTGWRDAHGDLVEDFGLEENLMIACSVDHICTSAQRAIAMAAQHLGAMPR